MVKKAVFVCAWVLLISAPCSGQDPIPCIQQTQCTQCHSSSERGNDPKKACTPFCGTCHQDLKRHHPTDLKVGDGVEGMVTDTKGNLSCQSCHDLAQKQFDDNPWKCQSLYSRLFKKESNYKTYFLVMRNHKGQLCRKCH